MSKSSVMIQVGEEQPTSTMTSGFCYLDMEMQDGTTSSGHQAAD
jgi:hypothetical protein